MVAGAAVLTKVEEVFGVVEAEVEVVDGIIVEGVLLDPVAFMIFWLGSLFKRFSSVTYNIVKKKTTKIILNHRLEFSKENAIIQFR